MDDVIDEVLILFSGRDMSSNDLPGAKFKIGQVVNYHHRPSGIRATDEVVLVKECEGTFEYVVASFGLRLWEYELSEV